MTLSADAAAEDRVDVLIVGAGLSGIGAARHLQRRCPGRTWAIVESRQAIGGTWDLFRYPGVRSDSDMYTLGYDFKPWRAAKAIADGPAILDDIREAADEAGITPRIGFGQRVLAADWSSADACWTVRIAHADGTTRTRRARFLYLCCGYYSDAGGHRPTFEGEADFRGPLVQPQFWPTGLDHAGKRVVVIGSGATAVTLVPEMAKTAAHVTMLQRSPTYVVSRPSVDGIAEALKRWLPAGPAHALVRWKNVLIGRFDYRLARRRPQAAKQRIVAMAAAELGNSCDAQTHFNPRYDPWDQRVCLVPDGDLFQQIKAGRAEVVTDTIDRFTAGGIRLASGRELPADIVVLATGLKLNIAGDIALRVDGRAVVPGRTLAYKGLMLALDVADRSAVASLPAAVLAAHGRVSLLINNAGVALGGTFEQVTEADFDWLLAINFHAVVWMTRAFLPLPRQQPAARIVNISGIYGIISPPGQTAYSAAKFAVRGFSNALRHELAGSTVGVTVVHPGGVATNIANRARVLLGGDARFIALLERLLPVRHWNLLARLMPPEARP